ncbi:hypothetical protein COO60DRAFT_1688664 [Scenedesmus sp. NREL 46B-D3]|nr:hypothetical protein COO60DRAFT_1688664 [Scenedesmus sp. NREL 46B-D3]
MLAWLGCEKVHKCVLVVAVATWTWYYYAHPQNPVTTAVSTSSCLTPSNFNVTEMHLQHRTWAPCFKLPYDWAQRLPPTAPYPAKKHLGAIVQCNVVDEVIDGQMQQVSAAADLPSHVSHSCSACRSFRCDSCHETRLSTSSLSYSSHAQRLQGAAHPAAVWTTSCMTQADFNVTEMRLQHRTWAPCFKLPYDWAQRLAPTAPQPAMKHLGANVQCNVVDELNLEDMQQVSAAADLPSHVSHSCDACRSLRCDSCHETCLSTSSLSYSSHAQRLQGAAHPAAVWTTSCMTQADFNVTEMRLQHRTWAPCFKLPYDWAQRLAPTAPQPAMKHLGANVQCNVVDELNLEEMQQVSAAADLPPRVSHSCDACRSFRCDSCHETRLSTSSLAYSSHAQRLQGAAHPATVFTTSCVTPADFNVTEMRLQHRTWAPCFKLPYDWVQRLPPAAPYSAKKHLGTIVQCSVVDKVAAAAELPSHVSHSCSACRSFRCDSCHETRLSTSSLAYSSHAQRLAEMASSSTSTTAAAALWRLLKLLPTAVAAVLWRSNRPHWMNPTPDTDWLLNDHGSWVLGLQLATIPVKTKQCSMIIVLCGYLALIIPTARAAFEGLKGKVTEVQDQEVQSEAGDEDANGTPNSDVTTINSSSSSSVPAADSAAGMPFSNSAADAVPSTPDQQRFPAWLAPSSSDATTSSTSTSSSGSDNGSSSRGVKDVKQLFSSWFGEGDISVQNM